MAEADQESLVRISSFHGGEYVRCTTCSAEADLDEEFSHHDRCPEVDHAE